MDGPACQIIYVNRNVKQDCIIPADPIKSPSSSGDYPAEFLQVDIRNEVQPLLDSFGNVRVCSTGAACIDLLHDLHHSSMMEMKPTMVLLDTPRDSYLFKEKEQSPPLSPSASRPDNAEIHCPDEELYGLNLLQKIMTEAHLRKISKLIVPVPVISQPCSKEVTHATDGAGERTIDLREVLAINRDIIRRCLDLGAVDVVISPLSTKCIATLEICAYRARRDAAREQQAIMEFKRGRQLSWVGMSDEKPFAYLREAMVSGLMKGICRTAPEDGQISNVHVAVSAERQSQIAQAIGSWNFCAHSFDEDELVLASMLMFRHALSMPELALWRIPADQLINFLVACRAAYNSFVPYHNFRHVVDVLQATFSFLVHIGALAPYPSSTLTEATTSKSPIAALLGSFEALTLLITAIGHDVGHPGVNNGFLVTLNAPLAQLYNDRSVLESFHCAAYSQILRRYWPTVFEDTKMRSLMISSILATDMGLHFDYMKKLGDLQEKLHEHNSTEGWNGRQIEEHKGLACALLIKCADISNVARRHDTALKWMHILSEEFSRQASMEDELQIQSSLMAPPKQDISSLAKSQLGFMNLFAIPLFQGVADIMPAMRHTLEEIDINRDLFQRKLEEERAKNDATKKRLVSEGTFSPRTMSYAVEVGDSDKDSMRQIDKGIRSVDGLAEQGAPLKSRMNGVSREGDKLFLSRLTTTRSGNPRSSGDGQEAGGRVSGSDVGEQFTNSGSFSSRRAGRLRGSGGTGDSTSATTADGASYLTSGAASRMPLSPSTQGTSIVSRDSGSERPSSAPGFKSTYDAVSSSKESDWGKNNLVQNGHIAVPEGKTLRKKGSRFRMKDFPFFRRNKGSPFPTTGGDSTN